MRNAIGVGSYGCVYRPPLHCENRHPPTGYADKIAKLMLDHHAIGELNEYNKIVKIDKQQNYFLGKPHRCKADESEVISTIDPNDCDIFDETQLPAYELLISKDGGMDLDDFLEKRMKSYTDADATAADRFLLNIHKLLLGIKLFNENDITHFDIKPSNIVFDEKTEMMKFIDFGLMDNISNVISGIKSGTQRTNIHWSYPLDYGFLKPGTFLSYDNLKTQSDVNYTIGFLQKALSKTGRTSIKTTGLPQSYKEDVLKIKEKSRGFSNTFFYMNNATKSMQNDEKLAMISATVNSVYAYKDRYDELLNKSVRTLDTYGMGFVINHVANVLYNLNKLTHDNYLEIHMFCHELFDFNVEARLDDMDMILVKYENVLQKIGVLSKLNMRFENHRLVKGSISSKTRNPKTLVSTSRVVNKVLDVSLEKRELVDCPNGKELDIIKKKCVKMCPAGKERNPVTGRCVKMCPPDKERNPHTGRCRVRQIKNKTQKKNITGLNISAPLSSDTPK